jgi:hypothetical protein
MLATQTTRQERTEKTAVPSTTEVGKTVLIKSGDETKTPVANLGSVFRTDYSFRTRVVLEELKKVLDRPGSPLSLGTENGRPYITTRQNLGSKRNPKADVIIVGSQTELKQAVSKAEQSYKPGRRSKALLVVADGLTIPKDAKGYFSDIVSLSTLSERLERIISGIGIGRSTREELNPLASATLPGVRAKKAAPTKKEELGSKIESQAPSKKRADERIIGRDAGIKSNIKEQSPTLERIIKDIKESRGSTEQPATGQPATEQPASRTIIEQERKDRGLSTTPTKNNEPSLTTRSLAEIYADALRASGVKVIITNTNQEAAQVSEVLGAAGKMVRANQFVLPTKDGGPEHVVIIPAESLSSKISQLGDSTATEYIQKIINSTPGVVKPEADGKPSKIATDAGIDENIETNPNAGYNPNAALIDLSAVSLTSAATKKPAQKKTDVASDLSLADYSFSSSLMNDRRAATR